jgi:alpha-glucoside transport system permease protein
MPRASAPAGRPGRSWPRLFLHAAIAIICVAWFLPSIGLLVSSFRPKNPIAITGWWEAFAPPFSFTLDNYAHVLTRGHMGLSFVNSLIIAVPSTAMPILIAAFAAYASRGCAFPSRRPSSRRSSASSSCPRR